jgi:hypothetical protein
LKITLDQLRIYERFDGDDDMFGRCGSADEKALIDNAVWRRITELVQAFSVASSPWGAEPFRASVEANLHDDCATPEAEALLRQIALGAAKGRDR